MSGYIKPCHGCTFRKECKLGEEYRSAIKGIKGLRSASFNCPRLAEELRPGRRIKVECTVGLIPDERVYGYQDDYMVALDGVVTATITSSKGAKFSWTIDPGELSMEDQGDLAPDDAQKLNIRRFRRPKHMRVIREFLDEPDSPISKCGNVIRDGACDLSQGHCCGQIDPRRGHVGSC